jgi:hypothetical protein
VKDPHRRPDAVVTTSLDENPGHGDGVACQVGSHITVGFGGIEKMLRFAFSFIVFQNDKGMARWLLMMACSLTVV